MEYKKDIQRVLRYTWLQVTSEILNDYKQTVVLIARSY